LDEIKVAIPPGRPNSAPLSPPEIRVSAPEGGLIQQRVNQSTSGNVNHSRKYFTLSLVATTLVSLILLVLLLVPRIFNFSIFLIGFPLFGTAHYATISVLVK